MKNGENIGRFSDVEIDTTKGRITALYVEDTSKILSFFSKPKSRLIKWEEIVKVGLDVIVVNYEDEELKQTKAMLQNNYN